MIPLLDHWGYLGIFLAVVLGNVGLPVPEETVLAMAGYAASRGVLHLPVILVIGVVSAVAGDNIGYWLGHRYGRRAIERFGHLAFIPPQRMQKITSFMTRSGPSPSSPRASSWSLPPRRAPPAAGATGMRPRTFVIANILGALVYVPYAVGIGYGIGWGFGDVIERFFAGRLEHIILIVVGLTLLLGVVRFRRARRAVLVEAPTDWSEPKPPAQAPS
jgi:membrane protein DedA with SNARE-associated domain